MREKFFVVYAKMFMMFGDEVDLMQFWFESCVCHGSNVAGIFSDWLTKRLRVRDTEWVRCVMKGRRAPELAAGKVDEFITQLMELFEFEAVELASILEPAPRDKVVSAWHTAKAHLIYIITEKFAYWKRLPYLLCGALFVSASSLQS